MMERPSEEENYGCPSTRQVDHTTPGRAGKEGKSLRKKKKWRKKGKGNGKEEERKKNLLRMSDGHRRVNVFAESETPESDRKRLMRREGTNEERELK